MNNYVATKWSSIDDKKRFEAQFKRFVESGYKKGNFPKWFYQRLSMCFGHIAHYNQGGFYAEQFSTPARIARWEKRIAYYKVCGDPEYTFSDVEHVLSAWMAERLDLSVADHQRVFCLG
jgi:hypothetical protein